MSVMRELESNPGAGTYDVTAPISPVVRDPPRRRVRHKGGGKVVPVDSTSADANDSDSDEGGEIINPPPFGATQERFRCAWSSSPCLVVS